MMIIERQTTMAGQCTYLYNVTLSSHVWKKLDFPLCIYSPPSRHDFIIYHPFITYNDPLPRPPPLPEHLNIVYILVLYARARVCEYVYVVYYLGPLANFPSAFALVVVAFFPVHRLFDPVARLV